MRRTAMALCALVTAACLLGGCTYAAVTAARRSDTYLLYFREADLTAAAGGDALRSEETVLEGVDELEPEEAALALMEALLRGPTDETLRSAIPAGTEVESVQVEGRRAVVDMSAGYGSLSGVPLALEALARSLCSLESVEEVQFLVDGEYADTYGPAAVRAPFTE